MVVEVTKIGLVFSLICVTLVEDLPYTQQQYDSFAAEQFPEAKTIAPFYDFIIIGAGSAGCTLANRLSEIQSWRILLIEAGGPENLALDIPGTASTLLQSQYAWQYQDLPSPNYGSALVNGSAPVPRGKVVGGCSSINLMAYTRCNKNDYNKWAQMGNINWSWETSEYYFKKLENYTVEPKAPGFGHHGNMHIQNGTYRTKFGSDCITAAEKVGLKYRNINKGSEIGIGYQQSTIKNGYRFSTNRAYLITIRDRTNLFLKTGCVATKINFDQLRAKSVTFVCNGSEFTVGAYKEIILSAGPIATPQILMLSGIGKKEDLELVGVKVLKELLVGYNLMDHVYPAGLIFTINKEPFTSETTEEIEEEFRFNQSGPLTVPSRAETMLYAFPNKGIQNIEFLISATSVFTNPGFVNEWNLKQNIYDSLYKPYKNTHAYTLLSILLKPKSRGWVKLRNTNPFEKPMIFHNFFNVSEDVDNMLRGIKLAINISDQLDGWDSKVFSKPLPGCEEYEFGSDDYWRCHIRAFPSTMYHVCGTCKMGNVTDPTAVVNQNLEVIGVEGLRVIDSSVIPEIPSGHLNGPTIMIAEHGADIIKAKYSKN